MTTFREANEKYGGIFLIACSLLVGLGILLSFNLLGYDETWALWRVPVERPPFSDFRVIPGSAESYRMGIEPTVRNPGDPHKRLFNYPAFWRLFFHTNVAQNDTVWMVQTMLALFFAGVFLFPHRITMLDSTWILLVVFSPALMLLYERGNVDLIVFFLCALVVLATKYHPLLTAALLLFAAIVKLYPFFGFTLLLKETRSKFIVLFLGCLGAFGVYLGLTSKSAGASWHLTMRGKEISYGAQVAFLRYDQYVPSLFGIPAGDSTLTYVPILLALGLILVAGIVGIARTEPLASSSERNLAAFRMGASIYAGTFLLGNNWDYRLAFLILVMPQVLQWSRHTDKRYRAAAKTALVAVLVSCWHFMVWFAPALADIRETLFILDEAVNWALVAGLSYLFFASLPAWAKASFRFFLPERKLERTA